MTALLACLAIGGGLVAFGFALGRAWERTSPTAPVIYLPVRHPSHHHRPARRAVHPSQPVLRLVTPIYDFDQEDPA